MFIESSDGVSIHYSIKRRSKPFIVLLHGMALSSESFRNIKLGNYSILAIDFRGHGKSGKPHGRKYYTLEKCVDDVKLILAKEKIKTFNIIGFSMGGYVAARLSNELRGVKNVVLINPALSKKSVKLSFIIEVFVSLFTPRFLLKPFVKDERIWVYYGLLDEYAKLLLKTPKHAYWNYLVNSLRMNDVMPRSDSVIIKSDNDEIVKRGSSTYIIKGHHHVLAENPKEINDLLKKLL